MGATPALRRFADFVEAHACGPEISAVVVGTYYMFEGVTEVLFWLSGANQEQAVQTPYLP